MKKRNTIVGAAVFTALIGAGAIFANSVIVSQALAAGFDAEISAVALDKVPETTAELEANFVELSPADEVQTLLKTLPNGEIVLVQYFYGESGANATVTYKSGDEILRVDNYEGDVAEAVINRFGGPDTRPVLSVQGQPSDGDMDEGAAKAFATEKIVGKYALKPELLERFDVKATFYTTFDGQETPTWFISLYPKNVEEFPEIGCYTGVLNGKTGEVVALLSAADGKG
ncbi:MAG: hypothetical protein LBT44_07995 [Clostridiales bacterium]|jgi:hypothetical protein|nr:hypothetical protein [Clostridiales bacterium]